MAKPHKLADGRYECQNCLRKFTKNEYTFKDPIFCKDACRKEYHANGGMSLKKLEDKIERIVDLKLAEKVRPGALITR